MMFSAVLSALLVFGSIGVTALLSFFFGDICWPPRIGATLVGAAVFLQGYIFADADRFSRKVSSGITLQQRVMHITFTAAVFGTLLGAFGDLIPSMYGVALCGAK